jgi:hypothetical protein
MRSISHLKISTLAPTIWIILRSARYAVNQTGAPNPARFNEQWLQPCSAALPRQVCLPLSQTAIKV